MGSAPPQAATVDLAAVLREGDHIVVAGYAGSPIDLVGRLTEDRRRLPPVELLLGMTLRPLIRPEHLDRLHVTVLGGYGCNRELTTRPEVDILPVQQAQLPELIQSGSVPVDVVFVQVSPPNENGIHSLGVCADYLPAAIAAARVVVAEVNDRMPWTQGDTGVPASRLDVVVPVSRALLESAPEEPGPVETAIAEHVAELIPDRSVLQVGIGKIPDAVLRALRGHRDLGVHSGMIGDGVLDLVESGAVTNAYKEIDRGVTVAGVLLGTKRLYDWAHANPALALRSTSYTHGAASLGALPTLVAVNSAVEVDLSGQVNAETVGGRYLGAVGGHVDFVRAGCSAPRGHSIIALPATAGGGAVSRIVPVLQGPTTTLRTDVDLVVTEFGVASLRGCTLAERARRLIAIADPGHRDELARVHRCL